MIKDATAWLAGVLAAGSLGFAGCAIIAGLDNTYGIDSGGGGSGDGGAGGSTSCTESSMCDDLNVCSIDTCDTAASKCVSTPVPDGPTPGIEDSPTDCVDRICQAGAEVAIPDDTEAPADDMNPCSTQTCLGGSPQTSFAPQDTACGGALVCDGMGNCVGCNMPDQCPSAPACQSRTCNNGVCGVMNVSAGSACQAGFCNGMGACVECLVDNDCPGAGTPICQNGKCVDSCANGMTNGDETDVDCGGNECPECADGKSCNGDDDCSSNNCAGGLCISCTDGVLNGNETDVDCGGTCQANCANGKMCDGGADCQSNKCTGGVCQP